MKHLLKIVPPDASLCVETHKSGFFIAFFFLFDEMVKGIKLDILLLK